MGGAAFPWVELCLWGWSFISVGGALHTWVELCQCGSIKCEKLAYQNFSSPATP